MNKFLVSIVAVAALFGASGYASPYRELYRQPSAVGKNLVLKYRSWSEVVICEQGRESEGGMVFRRTGLWSWKLVAIELSQPLPTVAK